MGSLIQMAMSMMFYVQVFVGDDIDTVYYYLMALMSPCAFTLGIDKVPFRFSSIIYINVFLIGSDNASTKRVLIFDVYSIY